MLNNNSYPATLEINYPSKLDRLTTFFRVFMAIPIVFILIMLDGGGGDSPLSVEKNEMAFTSLGVTGGLGVATALMIIFRQRYPKWWYDFVLEFNRFATRVAAYVLLLTDQYPSTEDKQSVKLDVKYPNVNKDLVWWMPIVKWFLAIPHYVILVLLMIGVGVVTVIAWFSILFTGQYPKSLFDYVVGVMRWGLRVNAYAFLLTTDKYPPFTLK